MNKIFRADCINEMSILKDKSVNLVVTDPPFGIDFKSDGGALTLSPSEVTEGNEESGIHQRKHKDGWTIKGKICEEKERRRDRDFDAHFDCGCGAPSHKLCVHLFS